MKVKVFVFRHTQSTDNKNELFSGRRDIDLTEEGVEQAQKIAEQLSNEDVCVAFTSPLRRTRRCLEIVLNDHHPNVEVIEDKRIIERDYGWLSGRSKEYWSRNFPFLFKIFHRSYLLPPPGGESLRQAQTRVLDFAKDMSNIIREKKCNAIVCAHSGSMRGLRQYFEGFSNSEFTKIESELGKVFIYELDV